MRPLFATLAGVSAPPPFGGSPRTIVIDVDTAKLQAYGLSGQDVVTAITNAETISPSGNIDFNGKYPVVPVNSIVENIKDLGGVAIKPGVFPTVFVRDLAKVSDSSDVPTSVALVNGKPTVYIPVTKRADASTLSVVGLVKANLARFQAALPDDVSVQYVFDQSPFVTRALSSLLTESALGAVLAGVMVLLFLRDWRGALIVVVTIPLSLLDASFALWVSGQTINIMTLGGLALAVGILIDESTVVVENTHTHLVRESRVERAVLNAGREVMGPRLLAMLCVLSVFLPSLTMQGTAKALFAPLAVAVGFSMVASYFLASTLVPVLCVWAFRGRNSKDSSKSGEPLFFSRLQSRYERVLRGTLRLRVPVIIVYLIVCANTKHTGGVQDSNGTVFDVEKDLYGRSFAVNAQINIGDAIFRKLAARQLQSAAAFDADAQRNDTALAGAIAYLNLVNAVALQDIAREALRISEEYEGQLIRATQIGIANKSDELRVRVQTQQRLTRGGGHSD